MAEKRLPLYFSPPSRWDFEALLAAYVMRLRHEYRSDRGVARHLAAAWCGWAPESEPLKQLFEGVEAAKLGDIGRPRTIETTVQKWLIKRQVVPPDAPFFSGEPATPATLWMLTAVACYVVPTLLPNKCEVCKRQLTSLVGFMGTLPEHDVFCSSANVALAYSMRTIRERAMLTWMPPDVASVRLVAEGLVTLARAYPYVCKNEHMPPSAPDSILDGDTPAPFSLRWAPMHRLELWQALYHHLMSMSGIAVGEAGRPQYFVGYIPSGVSAAMGAIAGTRMFAGAHICDMWSAIRCGQPDTLAASIECDAYSIPVLLNAAILLDNAGGRNRTQERVEHERKTFLDALSPTGAWVQDVTPNMRQALLHYARHPHPRARVSSSSAHMASLAVLSLDALAATEHAYNLHIGLDPPLFDCLLLLKMMRDEHVDGVVVHEFGVTVASLFEAVITTTTFNMASPLARQGHERPTDRSMACHLLRDLITQTHPRFDTVCTALAEVGIYFGAHLPVWGEGGADTSMDEATWEANIKDEADRAANLLVDSFRERKMVNDTPIKRTIDAKGVIARMSRFVTPVVRGENQLNVVGPSLVQRREPAQGKAFAVLRKHLDQSVEAAASDAAGAATSQLRATIAARRRSLDQLEQTSDRPSDKRKPWVRRIRVGDVAEIALDEIEFFSITDGRNPVVPDRIEWYFFSIDGKVRCFVDATNKKKLLIKSAALESTGFYVALAQYSCYAAISSVAELLVEGFCGRCGQLITNEDTTQCTFHPTPPETIKELAHPEKMPYYNLKDVALALGVPWQGSLRKMLETLRTRMPERKTDDAILMTATYTNLRNRFLGKTHRFGSVDERMVPCSDALLNLDVRHIDARTLNDTVKHDNAKLVATKRTPPAIWPCCKLASDSRGCYTGAHYVDSYGVRHPDAKEGIIGDVRPYPHLVALRTRLRLLETFGDFMHTSCPTGTHPLEYLMQDDGAMSDQAQLASHMHRATDHARETYSGALDFHVESDIPLVTKGWLNIATPIPVRQEPVTVGEALDVVRSESPSDTMGNAVDHTLLVIARNRHADNLDWLRAQGMASGVSATHAKRTIERCGTLLVDLQLHNNDGDENEEDGGGGAASTDVLLASLSGGKFDAEYRTVLQSYLSDLITTLHHIIVVERQMIATFNQLVRRGMIDKDSALEPWGDNVKGEIARTMKSVHDVEVPERVPFRRRSSLFHDLPSTGDQADERADDQAAARAAVKELQSSVEPKKLRFIEAYHAQYSDNDTKDLYAMDNDVQGFAQSLAKLVVIAIAELMDVRQYTSSGDGGSLCDSYLSAFDRDGKAAVDRIVVKVRELAISMHIVDGLRPLFESLELPLVYE
jgi:hypothetical protein